MLDEFFPFEKYINSCYEKEYIKDLRKKNYILKYINLLMVDCLDKTSLKKLCINMLFFRNIFSKDAFLEFFLKFLKEEEKELLGSIVFEMFVRSDRGEVGEYKEFCEMALQMYKYVDHNKLINENWEEIKKEVLEIV